MSLKLRLTKMLTAVIAVAIASLIGAQPAHPAVVSTPSAVSAKATRSPDVVERVSSRDGQMRTAVKTWLNQDVRRHQVAVKLANKGVMKQVRLVFDYRHRGGERQRFDQSVYGQRAVDFTRSPLTRLGPGARVGSAKVITYDRDGNVVDVVKGERLNELLNYGWYAGA